MQVEVEEALEKVTVTLRIFNSFRSAFREFKAKLTDYFDNANFKIVDDPRYNEAIDDDLRDIRTKRKKKQRETKPKTWEFQEELIFKRYDAFVDRLVIVKEFFKTADQFLKLEKVEMGGIRGKDLSSRIFRIYEEFKEQFTYFSNRTYDPLDPKDESFVNDYEKFKSKTFQLDRKLGAVLGRAFDDCLVTESIFKLLQIFGNLIQRTLISQELNDRMPILVQMLDQEMEEARVIYQKQLQRSQNGKKPIVDRNMPTMTGQLKWSQELRWKMSHPVKKFKELSHPVCVGRPAKTMFIKFKEINRNLDKYEEDVFKTWNESISSKVVEGKQRHLIVRDKESGKLRNNFSLDIASILREVRCLKKEFPYRYEYVHCVITLFENYSKHRIRIFNFGIFNQCLSH